jgi:hypothetical protein
VKIHYDVTRTTDTSHEDLWTLMETSRWILLGTRNILDKICTENWKLYLMFNKCFRKWGPFWGNVEKFGRAEQGADDNTTLPMRSACWLIKPTYAEHVILTVSQGNNGHANASQFYVYSCWAFRPLRKGVGVTTFLPSPGPRFIFEKISVS